MNVNVKIKGLEELQSYFVNLPKRISSNLDKTNEQFMKDVRKSAKLRAPRDTAKTAKSIRIEKRKGKNNQYALIVDSRAAIFQELGFKPHWIFIKEGYVYDKSGKSNQRTNKLSDGYHWVSKSKPFLVPALDANLAKLSQKLSKSMDKALK